MHKTKYVIEDELYTECVKIHPEALNTLEPLSIAAFYSQQEEQTECNVFFQACVWPLPWMVTAALFSSRV